VVSWKALIRGVAGLGQRGSMSARSVKRRAVSCAKFRSGKRCAEQSYRHTAIWNIKVGLEGPRAPRALSLIDIFGYTQAPAGFNTARNPVEVSRFRKQITEKSFSYVYIKIIV